MDREDVVVFGVASNGSTEQWDGHATPTGVLLRWFVADDLGYPDLGFDVYRAQVPDVRPLPFDDLNVPFVQGQTSWEYAGVTLTCATGLQFVPSGQLGWWQLVVTPASPVTLTYSSPAWLVQLRAGHGPTALEAVGYAAGVERRREVLDTPFSSLTWRTRGIESVAVTGSGALSFAGYHLVGDPASWTHLAHRCLPVIDPAYRCAPVAVTEAAEAVSRLPGPVAAEWSTRFDAPFATMLPALRRLATHQAPVPVATTGDPMDGVLATDEATLVDLAALDPHVARIVGLAYDDLLGGALDGHEYNYKVVGTWVLERFEAEAPGFDFDVQNVERHGGHLTVKSRGRQVVGADLSFDRPPSDVVVEMDVVDPVDWQATDATGVVTTGTLAPGMQRLALGPTQQVALAFTGAEPKTSSVQWQWTLERLGLLTGVVATDPGPPDGPSALATTVQPAESPSALAVAELDWDVPTNADGSLPEGSAVAYQIGRRQLLDDPTASKPAPGPAGRADLLYEGAPVYPSERATAAARPRTLHVDRNSGAGLTTGWWGWWARGVDLFGRVSAPSAWGLAALADSRPPPPPVLLAAEYAQPGLPPQAAVAVGWSAEARRWMQANPSDNGVIATWAFGPDELAACPDADGFRLLLRNAFAVSGAPAGSPLTYQEPWPSPVRSFGPLALRTTGTVTSVAVDPTFRVSVDAVSPVPRTPDGVSVTSESTCSTDLDLDAGSGVFAGGTLTLGGPLVVVGNGEGAGVALAVEHDAERPPAPGTGQLKAAKETLIEIATTAPDLVGTNELRARAGVLVVGSPPNQRRLRVVRAAKGSFLCVLNGDPPTNGDPVEWYPVWTATVPDTGFGPSPSESTPVAHAQVAVRAVRRTAASAVDSTLSTALGISAVDVTVPPTPTVTAISFDPADSCAVLASRADWYGHSHYSISWDPQPGRTFVVYRALADEVFRLDLAEHDSTGAAHSFADPADWPPGVFADATRKSRVLSELGAIDAARSTAGAGRAVAVAAAYGAATIDTQRLFARQPYARPAFVAMTSRPIAATNYGDVLDGRSRAHWHYAVASRTNAGLESALSEPTPPICCPDVVPPGVPVAHQALADATGGTVTLSWLASPDGDLDHYDIYAARHPDAIADIDDLAPVDTYAPTPHQPGSIVERSVAVAAGDWCFWIVAVDTSGNASQPSAMLRGRPLVLPPAAPSWDTPQRTDTAIALSWTQDDDQRLACNVERRAGDLGVWTSASGWLPRGQYSFDDVPPDLSGDQEYRIRVRDSLGQVADTVPTVTIAAVSP